MLDQVLGWFEIITNIDLDLMQHDQDLFEVTSSVLTKLKKVYADVRPDLVLVQGDTTTSTAAAIAAYYMQIEVGHIEAGLRTGDLYKPFRMSTG